MGMIDVGFIPFSSLNSILTKIAQNEHDIGYDQTKKTSIDDNKEIKVETVYNEHQLVLNIYEGEKAADENAMWYQNIEKIFGSLLSSMVQDLLDQYKDQFENQVEEMIMSSLGGVS